MPGVAWSGLFGVLAIVDLNRANLKYVSDSLACGELGCGCDMIGDVKQERFEHLSHLLISKGARATKEVAELVKVPKPIRHMEGHIARRVFIKLEDTPADVADTFLDGLRVHRVCSERRQSEAAERNELL